MTITVFEDRCRHDMLILNGHMTCSLCLGQDDTVELSLCGLTETLISAGQRPVQG